MVFAISLLAAPAQEFTIPERGPHHRLLVPDRKVSDPSAPAEAVPDRSAPAEAVIELQGGLHRWTDQGWVTTHPGLETFNDHAVARNLAYGAIIAGNLATPGALDFSLPDGQRLTGHLLGLALTDATVNRSVLIAEVKDCAGLIGGPDQNEITFADAFTDFAITVKYILQRDRISQHLILQQQLPNPREWGLTEDAILEVLTEFTEYPEVYIERAENGGPAQVANEHITFVSARAEAPRVETPPAEVEIQNPKSQIENPNSSALEFVIGRAFSLGDEQTSSVLVSKTWEKFEGNRTFLVEKIPWKTIAPALAKLASARAEAPLEQITFPQLSTLNPQPDGSSAPAEVAMERQLPERRIARRSPGFSRFSSLAQSSPDRKIPLRREARAASAGRDAAPPVAPKSHEGRSASALSDRKIPPIQNPTSARAEAPLEQLTFPQLSTLNPQPDGSSAPTEVAPAGVARVDPLSRGRGQGEGGPFYARSAQYYPLSWGGGAAGSRAQQPFRTRQGEGGPFYASSAQYYPLSWGRGQGEGGPASNVVAVSRSHALSETQTSRPTNNRAKLFPLPLGLERSGRSRKEFAEAEGRAAERRGRREPLGQGEGYVIDWELVTSLNSNLWKSDTTYYISGPITIKTNIFEGGCVIKYAPTNTAKLTITGPITCLTTNVSPVILTARDDHSVGEKIGNNALSGTYANTALDLNNSGTTYDLHDIRISHAATALNFFGGRTHGARNVQIIQADYAAKAYQSTFYLYNALFHRVGNAFSGAGTANTTGNVQHVTFNRCADLNSGTLALYMTNSILGGVSNVTSFTGAYNGTNTDPSAIFVTVGAGANYLTTNSSFRDAGTTNIDTSLLASLKQLTTYPPIIAAELTTLGNTTLSLSPQAARDTDTPDLGWHYAPIDYCFGGVYVTNSTITLSTGTTIALYSPTNGGSGYYGIALGDAGKLFSEGTATNLNRIVRYNCVQEQSTTTWNTAPLEHIATSWTNISTNPEMRLRFTEWFMPANDTYHFRGYDASGATPAFIDNQLHGGQFYSGRPSVNVTNCLFNRVAVVLVETTTNAMSPTLRNCLLYGGNLRVSNVLGGPWTFKDNVFDKVTMTQKGILTHDYNGYVTNTAAQWLTNSGSHDIFTNTFGWQNGALGRWYQPTNSIFIGAGSTNANYVGLYHYTVLTNNVKETNSIVDRGFHYVATISGVPIDTDGDGIPDYLEDLNGNGSVDSSETDWQNSGDGGLRVLITRPRNGTILP